MPPASQTLDVETLRALAVSVLRHQPNTQWVSFAHSVASEARSQNLLRPQAYELLPAEEDALQAIVWSMIAQGVLVPGPKGGGASQSWPFFRVTAFGAEVLASQTPPPHDPDGYLKRLKADIPAIAANADYDLYVGEALNSFVAGNYLATVLLVGVAAELAAGELADALAHWLPEKEAATIKRVETWKIAERFEEIRKRIEPRRPKLPRQFATDFEVQLLGIAAVLRRRRNEAGHPTGRSYTRGEAYNVLQMLPYYLKFLHDLAGWMRGEAAGSG